MDNNSSGSHPADMGTQDNILNFDELERSLNSILEEDEDVNLQFISDIEIRIRFIQTQFLANFKEADKVIDRMFMSLRDEISRRERQLKSELNEIYFKKLAALNSQINLSDSAASRGSTFYEQTKCLINFVPCNYNRVLQAIKSFGSIEGKARQEEENVFMFKGLTPKLVFGSPGGNSGQLCRPWGITTDSTGRILVSDRSNHRIQVFSKIGQWLFQFGKLGEACAEFNKPSGITVDANNRIIIADKDNHRIQVFTHMGKFLFTFGRLGSKPSCLNYPWGVSVNRKCQIAVADSKNQRVCLFSSKGQLLALFDHKRINMRFPKLAVKVLDSPRGLAFRSDGSLLITDLNNHHVVILNKDFTKYSILGKEGRNTGQFFRPQGIDVDSSGNIIVSDSKNFRIQMFDSEGNIIKCFGSQGNRYGEFDCPQDVCFHANGNICVVDLNNSRIQVF